MLAGVAAVVVTTGVDDEAAPLPPDEETSGSSRVMIRREAPPPQALPAASQLGRHGVVDLNPGGEAASHTMQHVDSPNREFDLSPDGEASSFNIGPALVQPTVEVAPQAATQEHANGSSVHYTKQLPDSLHHYPEDTPAPSQIGVDDAEGSSTAPLTPAAPVPRAAAAVISTETAASGAGAGGVGGDGRRAQAEQVFAFAKKLLQQPTNSSEDSAILQKAQELVEAARKGTAPPLKVSLSEPSVVIAQEPLSMEDDDLLKALGDDKQHVPAHPLKPSLAQDHPHDADSRLPTALQRAATSSLSSSSSSFSQPPVLSAEDVKLLNALEATQEQAVSLLTKHNNAKEQKKTLRQVMKQASFHERRPMEGSKSDEFTPKAIFSNKKIAPDIAEFLGHLAVAERTRRKASMRTLQQNLVQGGMARSPLRQGAFGKEEEESDDMEDLMRENRGSRSQSVLALWFSTIDARSKTLSPKEWKKGECELLARNLSLSDSPLRYRPRMIHMGMFFKWWKIGHPKEASRKLRLGVLSFLATQDLKLTKLMIWTDVSPDDQRIKDMFGPITEQPDILDAIDVTKFDVEAELKKIPPTLAQETLRQMFEKGTLSELRPEMFRSLVLYNYGGLWMDADAVLLQDLAPLMGEDWAYLAGRPGELESALISVSKPHSHFVNDYLMNLVMRDPVEYNWPKQKKPLLTELFEADPMHTNFHVLPPCFFEVDHSEEEDLLGTQDVFFSRKPKERVRKYWATVSNASAELEPDEWVPASFGYHWRARWNASFLDDSVAHVIEQAFMSRLGIDVGKD